MSSTSASLSVDSPPPEQTPADAEVHALVRSRVRRAIGFLAPHKKVVAGVVLLALVMAAFAAVEPLILKYIFDGLGEGGASGEKYLLVGAASLLGVLLLRELFNAVSQWLTWRTRINVHYALTSATVSRLHTLPVSFHRAEGVGALMTRLDRGIQGLVGAITDIAINVIPALVYLSIAAVVMFQLDWRLALVVVAFAPVPGIIARLAAPRQTQREKNLLDRWAKIYSRFNEVLSGIVTVKSFAMEEREKQRFLTEVREANDVVIRGVGYDSGVGGAQNLVVGAARLAAIAFGGVLVLRGEVTVGTLVAFLGYVGGLFAPVQGLSGIYRTLKMASVSLEQVFNILDAQDELGDSPDAVDLEKPKGAVSFEDIHFRYPTGAAALIDGVTLEVKPGESIALVGPSGAGKTTLMALLQRFYDPTSGTVRVDGHDVRTLKQVSLRQNIGVVLQDALLFNESVRDNIAYGRPGASHEEVEAVAKAAHAHDFIMQLPEGYDTVVGERGSRLSAGERQRIAIARSLLKDPPILVLDEPTSALDAESEALVSEALGRLLKGRTSFVIAHRLSTVVDADRILVLRNGRIVESGRHPELLAQDGYYASLVRRQTRGLLPSAA